MSVGIKALGVLSAALLAGCSISGNVATDGTGLGGVTVRLDGPAGRTRTTSEAGNYTFDRLSAGSYTVTPWKPGYEMTPAYRKVTLDRPFEHVRDANFSAKKLLPVVAPVLGNITATDLQNDGTFDNINTATPVEAQSSRLQYLNLYVTRRAIFEFDLSRVSRSVPLRSAILDFTVSAYGDGSGTLQLDFHGYKGDGVLSLADAVAGDSLVKSIAISSVGVKQIDLKDFVQGLVDTGSSVAGLNVRVHSESVTSNVNEHCSIVGHQSTSPTRPPPRLTIDY